ncbi:hypothetical protein chiPu_0021117 [Chiloscyllium punctatum]|uniref:Uncharacterized protein n=1 Tax=Chiloscyllium punctatum TaxID=137246 RepID=A0A401RNG6_CHIPU|nr:hypothetical protein [Chiloscyllium punctatum]
MVELTGTEVMLLLGTRLLMSLAVAVKSTMQPSSGTKVVAAVATGGAEVMFKVVIVFVLVNVVTPVDPAAVIFCALPEVVGWTGIPEVVGWTGIPEVVGWTGIPEVMWKVVDPVAVIFSAVAEVVGWMVIPEVV